MNKRHTNIPCVACHPNRSDDRLHSDGLGSTETRMLAGRGVVFMKTVKKVLLLAPWICFSLLAQAQTYFGVQMASAGAMALPSTALKSDSYAASEIRTLTSVSAALTISAVGGYIDAVNQGKIAASGTPSMDGTLSLGGGPAFLTASYSVAPSSVQGTGMNPGSLSRAVSSTSAASMVGKLASVAMMDASGPFTVSYNAVAAYGTRAKDHAQIILNPVSANGTVAITPARVPLPIPEPESLALVGIGGLIILGLRRRFLKKT